MPLALLAAFVTSLGVHALALFGVDVDLSTLPEPPPLQAELRMPAEAPSIVPDLQPALAPSPKPLKKPGNSTRHRPASASHDALPAEPTLNATHAPDESATLLAAAPLPAEKDVSSEAAQPSTLPAPQFPARGMIRYNVERGDQGFVIGHATHRWEIADGRYRLLALTETTGLVAFLKPLRIELESRGSISAQGFRPESFVTRRNGNETGEKVAFDWEAMQLRIGESSARPLVQGTQDLLSFHYQLALLADGAAVSPLPIASGRKFEHYRLEILGDEEIETPAGHFLTLHLRVPGNSMTELWLARTQGMLPVKIRHVDRRGDSFVQIATEIGSFGPDSQNSINE